MSKSFAGKSLVCLDCETTGLDPKEDRVIEFAAVRFDLEKKFDHYETLIDPERDIPLESMQIHNITQEMVTGKPKIEEVLLDIFSFVGRDPIVGHGIAFDINVLMESAKRFGISPKIATNPQIDTLRMARLYEKSPKNSLVGLREHFGIDCEIAHRAMGDVLVNIEVFRNLVYDFKSYKELMRVLSKPVKMRRMPLGKHKGRIFSEIPLAYLKWASYQKFDEDLLFSIRSELKSRKQSGGGFGASANPFHSL